MAVYSVDIKSPAQGAAVSPQFTVDVEVGRDDQEAIMVLVAVEKAPPIDVYAPWDELSKDYWLVCEPSGQFLFHHVVSGAVGAYFVRARASITKSGDLWSDWTADGQNLEITVRSGS